MMKYNSRVEITVFNCKKLVRFFIQSSKDIYYLKATTDNKKCYLESGIYKKDIAQDIWRELYIIGYKQIPSEQINDEDLKE